MNPAQNQFSQARRDSASLNLHSLGRSSRGFTLVELLVVIAIIGVLIALLLPAVQAAREAARRVHCTNNMKQIGLALANYHDTNKTLPFGSGYLNAPTGTWVSSILPQMELGNLFDQFDFDVYLDHANNRTAITTPIPALICPSDDMVEDHGFGIGVLDNRRVSSNAHNPPVCHGLWYPACMGPTEPDFCRFGADPTPSPYNPTCQGCNLGTANSSKCSTYRGETFVGMFGRHVTGIPFRRVTDGLSNTFMVGETLPEHCVWNGAFMPNFPVATTHIPLNNMATDDGQIRDYWLTSGYKSLHPGGAHLVMGDSSVHFVNESIDYVVYNNLGTRAGEEPVTLGDF